MAPDQPLMTDEEFEAFEAAMDEQREDLLEAFAEDLGGDPDDYRVGEPSSADGDV